MTDTETAKPKRGRPRKIATPDPSIAALQAEVAVLKASLAEAQSLDRKPNYDPAPPASENLPPGSYVKVGVDGTGHEVMAKVRWSRSDVERKYAPVTFTPRRSMYVAPHGVPFQLTEEQEITVPGIVRDIYNQVVAAEREQAKRYPPMSANEILEIDARANAEPGSKQWSRLVRTGYGISIADDATTEGLAPAQTV